MLTELLWVLTACYGMLYTGKESFLHCMWMVTLLEDRRLENVCDV